MIRRARLALSALVLAGATSGCASPPLFEAVTTPPPFTRAELCDRCDGGDAMTITLTRGVALAFECLDATTGAPCSRAAATAADGTVAQVWSGYLDTLAPATPNAGGGVDGATAESVFVVVGAEVGQTTLSYTSASGDAVFSVSVVAP